jgi:hypothetical protein
MNTATTPPSPAFNYAEHDKQLRKLFELAEDNQLAVQDAIACLSSEREALSKERLTLAKASVNSAEVSETLRRATADAIPAIAEAADKSIQSAMDRALGVTHDAVTRLWSGTTAPAVERIGSVAKMANEMEARIRHAGYRHAWQWTALSALGVLATLVVAVVGVQQIKAQQTEVQRQQAELTAQRQAFSEEMARMQASVVFLERKGGRIRLNKCGPEQRLCIEVAPDQGNNRGGFRGPWNDAKNERTFVIPRGY